MSPSFAPRQVEATGRALLVWSEGGVDPIELPWFWVRDHSRDEAAFNPDTQQRRIDSFKIDLDCSASGARIVGHEIHVDWGDGSASSILPASLFKSLLAPLPPIELWRDASAVSPVLLDYEILMDSDESLASWLESIRSLGFGLVSGVPGTISGAESVAERVGYVRRTVFGDMWTLSPEVRDHADSAYDTTFIGPHTDGSYSHDAPGLQMFACSERSGEGASRSWSMALPRPRSCASPSRRPLICFPPLPCPPTTLSLVSTFGPRGRPCASDPTERSNRSRSTTTTDLRSCFRPGS